MRKKAQRLIRDRSKAMSHYLWPEDKGQTETVQWHRMCSTGNPTFSSNPNLNPSLKHLWKDLTTSKTEKSAQDGDKARVALDFETSTAIALMVPPVPSQTGLDLLGCACMEKAGKSLQCPSQLWKQNRAKLSSHVPKAALLACVEGVHHTWRRQYNSGARFISLPLQNQLVYFSKLKLSKVHTHRKLLNPYFGNRKTYSLSKYIFSRATIELPPGGD